MIVDELKEAETEYPPEIIIDAFRSAAENKQALVAICKQNTFGLDAQQQALKKLVEHLPANGDLALPASWLTSLNQNRVCALCGGQADL